MLEGTTHRETFVLLQNLITKLYHERPENPVKFLEEASRSPSLMQTSSEVGGELILDGVLDSKQAARRRPSVSGSDYSSDDDGEQAPISLHPKSRKPPGSRRPSLAVENNADLEQQLAQAALLKDALSSVLGGGEAEEGGEEGEAVKELERRISKGSVPSASRRPSLAVENNADLAEQLAQAAALKDALSAALGGGDSEGETSDHTDQELERRISKGSVPSASRRPSLAVENNADLAEQLAQAAALKDALSAALGGGDSEGETSDHTDQELERRISKGSVPSASRRPSLAVDDNPDLQAQLAQAAALKDALSAALGGVSVSPPPEPQPVNEAGELSGELKKQMELGKKIQQNVGLSPGVSARSRALSDVPLIEEEEECNEEE